VPSGGCHTDIKYVSVMATKDLKVEVESLSLSLDTMQSFAWNWVLHPPSDECHYNNMQFVNLMSHLDVHVEPVSGVSDALNVPQAIKSGQHTV